MLQSIAVCCSVLQCVAVRKQVLAELQELTKEVADQQCVCQVEKSAQNYNLYVR